MKKIILTLLILILNLIPVVKAEELPVTGCRYPMTKETNPIYWGYMEDYAAKLKEALEKKKMFRLRGMGAAYRFFITRDGQIKDITIDIYQNEYFNRKVKEIIESVEPLPFRNGMNLDEMQFSVYLGYENYDEIRLSLGLYSNIDMFQVTITTTK